LRLSQTITSGITAAQAGAIINKFRLRQRRATLFFEDIIAQYVKECDEAGHYERMRAIGEKWFYVTLNTLVPEAMKRLPPDIFFNVFLKGVWYNMGCVTEFALKKEGNAVHVHLEGDPVSRIIGKNSLMVGCSEGILAVKFGRKVTCKKAVQTTSYCDYIFTITDEPFRVIPSKSKAEYDELNSMAPVSGFTLQDALKARIFVLKEDNRLFFRGRPIWYVENTFLHLFGNEGPLLSRVPKISKDFFESVLEPSSKDDERLKLLKTLLQVMGWGIVSIRARRGSIAVSIANPPYGFQTEKDNWVFLAKTVEGYLRTMGGYMLKGIIAKNKLLLLKYASE